MVSEGEIISSSWIGAEDVEKSINKKSHKQMLPQQKRVWFLLLLSPQWIFKVKLQSVAWNRNLFKLDPYPDMPSLFDLVNCTVLRNLSQLILFCYLCLSEEFSKVFQKSENTPSTHSSWNPSIYWKLYNNIYYYLLYYLSTSCTCFKIFCLNIILIHKSWFTGTDKLFHTG